MYGLIYKDFFVNRKNILLFSIGIIFVQCLQIFAALSDDTGADENVFLYTLVGVISVASAFYVLGVLELSFFEKDERKKWAYYVAASESGAKAQVGAKYICIYLLSTGGMLLCNIINSITIDLLDNSFNVMGISAVLFFVQMFLRAIDIPFTIAFGTKRGQNMRALGLIVLIFVIAAYLLFGDLSFFGNSMDGFWDRFFELFDTAKNAKLMIGFMAAALAVMPLYYLSYRISCRYYLKGVDGYDK